jgi:replicative DNA helicase
MNIPYDLDAEENVNGSLLLGAELPDLKPDDFYSEQNGIIFKACRDLSEQRTPINQTTLAYRLNELNKLDRVGGTAYLSHLISIVPTHLDCDYYADIVKRTSTYRKMIWTADKISKIGYEANGDVNQDINEVLNLAKGLTSETKSKLYTGRELADAVMDISNKTVQSLQTPWGDINRITGGLFGGELTVIGAWTGQGKTEFVLQLLLWLAKRGYPVLLASLEMLEKQVAQRITSIETGISGLKLKTGDLTPDEMTRIMDIGGMVSEIPFKQLFESASLQQIRATLEKSEDKIKLVAVDYLTVLPDFFDNRCGASPRERMNYITHTLKQMAREYDIPVLAISQFARQGLEKKKGGLEEFSGKSYPEPHPSYFKESGSIEQEADNIWTLFRPELNDGHKAEDEGKTIFKQHKVRTAGDSIDPFKKVYLKWKEHKFYGMRED